jgi:hypothetical protein
MFGENRDAEPRHGSASLFSPNIYLPLTRGSGVRILFYEKMFSTYQNLLVDVHNENAIGNVILSGSEGSDGRAADPSLPLRMTFPDATGTFLI